MFVFDIPVVASMLGENTSALGKTELGKTELGTTAQRCLVTTIP